MDAAGCFDGRAEGGATLVGCRASDRAVINLPACLRDSSAAVAASVTGGFDGRAEGGATLVGCRTSDCAAINSPACLRDSSAAVAASVTPLTSLALYFVSNLLTRFLQRLYMSLAAFIFWRTVFRSLYSCS